MAPDVFVLWGGLVLIVALVIAALLRRHRIRGSAAPLQADGTNSVRLRRRNRLRWRRRRTPRLGPFPPRGPYPGPFRPAEHYPPGPYSAVPAPSSTEQGTPENPAPSPPKHP
ncbi:hypothetical protein SAMN05421748_13178 [Paractinoplanes atraurantiacus]|uniref:Uncharacterized protein n=1 Tax=Paractinoplanes atraurantiacus TaxID=1036182 RepID=A0A285K3X4_9ACTN|nr:hypothetical protein SAMN05421748_13178 [Actinoplanes atraurantiacus]